jgi:hypothetical protein
LNVNIEEHEGYVSVTHQGVTRHYKPAQTLQTVIKDCEADTVAHFEETLVSGIQRTIQQVVEQTTLDTNVLDHAAIQREVARYLAMYSKEGGNNARP